MFGTVRVWHCTSLDHGGVKVTLVHKTNMSELYAKVSELMENQKHILEAIKYLDEQIKDILEKAKDDKTIQVENILESQAMVDEIIVKNSDDIKVLMKTKEENAVHINILEGKIENIDKEIGRINNSVVVKEDEEKNKLKKCIKSMKCDMCEKTFKRFVDLEIHIKSSHAQHELFQCGQCEKHFSLKWRLQKHMNLHTEKATKHCHYFNNCDKCPFEEYGCKFLHSVSKMCTYSQTCERNLCPYRHSEERNYITNLDDVEESDIEKNDITSDEKKSFTTSTPRKRKFECEECDNESQCTDCFVRQDMATRQQVNFADDVEFGG